jgi:hypothetical protein
MDVSAKLQIKPGQRVVTIGAPDDAAPIAGEGAAGTPETADVVVAFVRSKAELATVAVPAIEAARNDKLAWIAYPKAGKLGTDLNRDLLSAALAPKASSRSGRSPSTRCGRPCASVRPNLITARSGAEQMLAIRS